MIQALVEKISGLLGLLIFAIFILGLAESISSGAAGFWGGFPFWVICFTILPLLIYDFWDSCLRKKK
ncbi:MAG TPA: hypothetical protein EYG61_11675 [Deltaproteobacteria bacterium]|jgi:sterol desaturase/sphingolipid hydroxylase (fatty acid hydroxylase superfamily)|nr:hypothetical protein [SAR324 cluster bacterium]HIO84657.1 hypothetical protein [Deltaproteobacteria bacterium]